MDKNNVIELDRRVIGIDPLTELLNRLSLLPSMDATDRQLQQHLIDDQAAAGKAFGVATVALETALDRARAHDEKGGM